MLASHGFGLFRLKEAGGLKEGRGVLGSKDQVDYDDADDNSMMMDC